MTKKIGNIKCCKRCPLRIYRRVASKNGIEWKSFCVGNSDVHHPKYSYFIRINCNHISNLELTNLLIIHPDCPLEEDR